MTKEITLEASLPNTGHGQSLNDSLALCNTCQAPDSDQDLAILLAMGFK